MIKRYQGVLLFLVLSGMAYAQPKTTLSLSDAYDYLENRYPVLKNGALLNQIHQLELEQLDKTSLPSIYWKADGQVQTGSTSIEASDGAMFPLEIDQPLYSARTYLEGQYMIKDGGLLDAKTN